MKTIGLHPPRPVLSLSLLVAVFAPLVLLTSLRPGSPVGAAPRPVSGGAPSASGMNHRPNIVMLMTDDQTVADLQVMPQTRRLIGAAGVSFSNSFVSYPMCCPSRATYFTGQYAHNHGVLYNNGPHGGFHAFTHAETSFPAALQRAGYFTIHIGKYLNGFGSRTLHAPAGWNDFRGALDPTTYNYYGFSLDENGKRRTYPPTEPNYRTDVYARMASAIIRRRARSHRPFFLNVAFLAPHSAGPQEEAVGVEPAWMANGMMDNRLAVPPRRYRGRLTTLSLPHPASFDKPDLLSHQPAFMRKGTWRSFFRRFTPFDVTDMTRRYHARLESLLAVDDAVEQIVTTLERTGLLGHTVILFTSDNGFFQGEHRIRAGKYFPYDPATRVPLLIRGPGIAAGVTRSELVGNIDLAPTILALGHARPLRVMDGRSLLPLLTSLSPSVNWQRDLLLESGPNTEFPAVYHAIRTDHYLYVQYSTGDRELYDLETDPAELVNRQDDPAYASIRAELAQRLARLETCQGASCR
jgi:N-acetylglucosamine-6-sulfatase